MIGSDRPKSPVRPIRDRGAARSIRAKCSVDAGGSRAHVGKQVKPPDPSSGACGFDSHRAYGVICLAADFPEKDKIRESG